MPTKVFNPLPHTAARDHIAGLPLVSRDVLDGMLPELKAYFFTVKGLDSAETLSRIRKHLADVPDGADWQTKKKAVAAELAAVMDPKEATRRAETLMRTHVFRAYAATRYRTLMAQRDIFPFWQYKTHGDGRVRPAHAALSNKVFPAGHSVWQTIFPPWGWGCRCLVVPLTKRSAEKMSEVSGEKSEVDGNLLPTQMAKPEIFSEHESDMIARARRLPGGISLEPEPSWGKSPWSEKGGVKHTWGYVQHLYGDDPVILDTFRKWAAAKKLPDMGGATVLDWLEAEGSFSFYRAMSGEKALWVRGAENIQLRDRRPARKSPASDHIEVLVGDAHGAAMTKAKWLVDHTHDDGGLSPVVMDDRVTGVNKDGVRALGSYLKQDGVHPARVGVGRDGPPLLTSLHELGHHIGRHLDPQDVHALAEAARQTKAARLLTSDADYWLKSEELWSRAYAQYVIKRTALVDAEGGAELTDLLSSHAYAEQWEDEEWKSLSLLVESALKHKGWL